jgi:methionyl-tRNA formyltransferase
MNSRRHFSFVFFGTPHMSVYVLEELQKEGLIPSLIVSAPAQKAGRGLHLTNPPVAEWALAHDIPLIQPENLRDPSAFPELWNTPWEVGMVCAYGFLIPQNLLSLPQHGMLNIHPSLLPLLRGSSPVRSALRENLPEAVGASVILLDEKMDHGPLLGQARVELPEWPLLGSQLDEILFREGGRLLTEILPLWCTNKITPEPQDHDKATFTKKFTKEDGLISLNDDAFKNWCTYCAMDGWPGTYFFQEAQGKKVRIKITDASFTNGIFTIHRVIPEGKKEQEWRGDSSLH